MATTWPSDRVHGSIDAARQTAWAMEIMPRAIAVNPRVSTYAGSAELVDLTDSQVFIALDDAGQVVQLDSADSIAELAERIGCTEAAASARVRDLRKARFGAHRVERRRVEGGLFVYKLVTGK